MNVASLTYVTPEGRALESESQAIRKELRAIGKESHAIEGWLNGQDLAYGRVARRASEKQWAVIRRRHADVSARIEDVSARIDAQKAAISALAA